MRLWSDSVNPVSVAAWSWRAMRGHSVIFASLFASAVLGLSVISGFRYVLTRLGAPWYAWLLVPIVVVGYCAKKEHEWIPEPERRRIWARRIVFGSIVLSLLIAWATPSAPHRDPDPAHVGQPARR